MTRADIDRLVKGYLDRELDEWETYHIEGRLSKDNDEIGSVLADRLEEATVELAYADYSRIKETAETLLKENRKDLPATSPAFLRLCHSLLRAQQTILRTVIDRLDGQWDQALPSLSLPSAEEIQDVIPIGEAVRLYFGHYSHRQAKTNNDKRTVLRWFIQTLPSGDNTPISRVKKSEVIAFRDAYSKMPRRVLSADRKLPILDLIQKMKGTKYQLVTGSTVNNALADLRHFFSWAMRHDHYPDGRNPADGIDLEGVTEKHYDAFSDEEVTRMFTHSDFLKQRETYPARYWLPLILLYTGARREEIAQLSPTDIKQDGPVWYFDITDDAETGKRVKNTASKRRTPVHSKLIELGLLEFVNRRHGEPLLLPKQQGRGARLSTRRRTCGDSVGKWHTLFRAKAGIEGRKTLHSFRGTLVTKLLATGCPEDIRKIIVGHASEDVHGSVYTKRDKIPLVMLNEHLERVAFKV